MKRLIVFCLTALLAGGAYNFLRPAVHAQVSQTPASNTTLQDPPVGQDQPVGRPGTQRGGQQSTEPQPYDRVITKDAKTMEGIFTIHRIKDKLYYEIPKNQLGKEFLWVSLISKTTGGAGQGGQAAGNRVIRWERRENKVFLKSIDYAIVADSESPIAKAVEAANNDTIIMAFNIEAFGKDDAPVIDVSRLFATEVPEFSARTRIGARGFDPSRSFLERAVAFPQNVEVEATHTFTAPPDSAPAGGGGRPGVPGGQQPTMRTGS